MTTPRSKYMTYKNLKFSVVSFLILYFVIGITAHATRRGTEDVYPFFSWFLFVEVPPRIQSGFDIRVISIEAKALDAPQSLSGTDPVFIQSGLTDKALRDISNGLGQAIMSKNEASLTMYKNLFESKLARSISYEVSAVEFNPIDRVLSKKVSARNVLGEFIANHIKHE